MTKFIVGEHASTITEFKKGMTPWNKGKTYKNGPKSVPTPKGKNHPNWKGGVTRNHAGYLLQSIPQKKGRSKQVYQHRFVMEQYLGRKLERGEAVHHLNGDITDNRLENLKLMRGGEHTSFEMKLHPERYYSFKKGETPPPHKIGCGCFRCSPYTAKMWERVRK